MKIIIIIYYLLFYLLFIIYWLHSDCILYDDCFVC